MIFTHRILVLIIQLTWAIAAGLAAFTNNYSEAIFCALMFIGWVLVENNVNNRKS
jgi:hypothetical protein